MSPVFKLPGTHGIKSLTIPAIAYFINTLGIQTTERDRGKPTFLYFGDFRTVPELEILTILPDLTLNFVTLIGRPQCNGRNCWQASLSHLSAEV